MAALGEAGSLPVLLAALPTETREGRRPRVSILKDG